MHRGSGGAYESTQRVLIVDDDEDDAMLTEVSLLKARPDVTIEILLDPIPAFAAIQSGKFDAALIDYRLGATNGLSLIERCRSAGSSLPLILLTGHGGLDVDLEAMRRGATDYLGKDEMTPATLERSIRYAMERDAAAAELLASQRRYEAAVRGSHDGIWDWDVRSGELYLSERFKAILGFDHDTMADTKEAWFSKVHEEDRPALVRSIDDLFTGQSPTLAIEYRMRHRNDGEWRWVFLRGAAQYDSAGDLERIAGSQSDISDRKIAEEEVRHRALHDTLTGLANRQLLEDRIEHAVQRVRRESGYGFSLLYLDLDGFKPINDRLGHLAGDTVLVELARRLRESVRTVDCVSRIGGDEFVVLLDRCTRKVDAEMVSRQIESAFAEPIVLPQADVRVGVSIGQRVVRDAATPTPELLNDADRAMYAAKLSRRRGDAIKVLPGGRSEQAVSFEADLRTGIATGAVRPHFQPIVDAESKRIVGYEALARWVHHARGNVSPAEFIPLAERSGLITDLGRAMLHRACQWASRLDDDAFVSVNVSPTHIILPSFCSHVDRALESSGLAPHRLRIEVTEHEALEDEPAAIEAMERLSKRGVKIELDDFGTGYSNLELLLQLPLSGIKLDRSIVSAADTQAKKLAMIQHLIGLAHTLGASVTAEGIETQGEYDCLRSCGVDLAQGFFFGRPAARH